MTWRLNTASAVRRPFSGASPAAPSFAAPVRASFTYFWTPEDIHQTSGDPNTASRNDELGYEIDLQATYDYTEDVSFGLLWGWFVPGGFYGVDTDDTAIDVVSSVKVSF